jgi:transglutaminase-like putative cysteine protease
MNMNVMAPTPAGGQEFRVDCLLTYEVKGTTDFVFQIHALNGRDQIVLSESLTLTPPMPVPAHIYNDPTELHRCTRLQVASGVFQLHYQARVLRTIEADDLNASEVPIWQLPDEVLQYLMPTRYCESDLLSHAAQKLFGGMAPGHARVNAICDWIHAHIDYQVGTSTATTTARDVFTQRAGVCRDFAHLGVTFCRALNIPARLVAGYSNFATPPPDFHAVFEAYLGGRWVIFDATRMSDLDGLVRIASGRDAKDVAFAMIYGPATMTSMNPTATPVQ